MKALVSGAGIAGPTLAYWLRRHGWDVTVVEKAPAVRGGGYPIDVRGTALDVLDRMGVLPRARAAHIDTRQLTFLSPDGRVAGRLRPRNLSGDGLELPRGVLTTILCDLVRHDARFRFGDSMAAIDGRRVTFASGAQEEFDVILGADGLHSATRRLVFGPEESFSRHLGYVFAGFTLPNDLGLRHEGQVWSAPGRMATLYAPGCSDTVHGLLMTRSPEPPRDGLRLLESAFAGDGWLVPRLLDGLRTAGDVFLDVVSQIHMPTWSHGRVALVGDAAHAPSFFSGQGTSIALVGAYVLAEELATHADPTAAFAAYEQKTRDFVRRNQALADGGGGTLAPDSARALWFRNHVLLKAAPLLGATGLLGRSVRHAATALRLPAPVH
ncbi:FAD-dependent oxidoreductase [Actinoplanes sp. SE50]|uniref:FAD-dependent monooxygenase n=1 Tax=unclassified Actinoplanes TaxID=2626549 RepID=UPI00023ECCC4|nr:MULTISPECIES: FAD-dependent monooxygenase [unclassified Actinoplanes]AEV84828.1 3-(3-hydroxy-phenyl)propionate/3- hydroxycinnamic acid hydroxylase [Actinoplanes sp. SE50/110]ATO83220.1 FAD-dependent oxidoreductase [Actinoplanes sp. SE50]SLM00627.1 FAD-dependent oxidoreductase [Actinoplanes sp. SE50/110]